MKIRCAVVALAAIALTSCQTVTPALTNLVKAETVTERHLNDAANAAAASADESTAIVALAEKTNDATLIAAVKRHDETVKSVQKSVMAAVASHKEETQITASALQQVAANDRAMAANNAKLTYYKLWVLRLSILSSILIAGVLVYIILRFKGIIKV